jgi:hypothetical protein
VRIDAEVKDGIPLTSPTATLIDLVPQLTDRQLEAAVNEADARDLATPDEVREAAAQTHNLVVEADSLRYHRTPAQQARDHLRDQEHAAGGRHRLRFTHSQIRYEPRHVQRILQSTASMSSGQSGILSRCLIAH